MRSMPRMVTVGYNPNYLASGPPVRPQTGRNRPLDVALDTQMKFERLLKKDEGQPKDPPSTRKRSRPAKYDRRPKTTPSPRVKTLPPIVATTGFSSVRSKVVVPPRVILGHEYEIKDPQTSGPKRRYRDPRVFDSWKVERGQRVPTFHGSAAPAGAAK